MASIVRSRTNMFSFGCDIVLNTSFNCIPDIVCSFCDFIFEKMFYLISEFGGHACQSSFYEPVDSTL